MSTIKAFVQGAVGRLLFRNATILRADALGPRFRRLVLGGPELAGVTWTPGDKLQVFLPTVGTRTYTPTRWNPDAGETELIAFLHGQGPGARWASDVQVGETVQIFGPRGSLVVDGSAVVVGDETSVGLVCARRPTPRAVLEVTSCSELQAALSALDLTGVTLIERAADDAHGPALVDAVARILAEHPLAAHSSAAALILSGRAAAIQIVRRGLKARGIDPGRGRTKAYWAPGKTGLD